MLDGRMYKRGLSGPLLRCLTPTEATKVLEENHEGVCGNHAGGQSLAHKALLQGYFWPSMKKDAFEFARKCDRCQRYSPLIKAHPEKLTPIFCPWPFAKWGVDLIGALPMALGGFRYAIVAVDYFTK